MCRHLLVPLDDSLLAVETVRKAVEFARQMYDRITFLHVQEENASAQALYRTLGFTERARLPLLVVNRGY